MTSAQGALPLLTPMSEVAGRMAPHVGARCLEKENGGRGVLLGTQSPGSLLAFLMAVMIIAGPMAMLSGAFVELQRASAAADFVKNYLWTNSAPAVNYAGQTITVPHSGLSQIFAGQDSAQYFGVPSSDPRHPDVFGISQVGTIYTGGSKIAEHGGANPGDRDVPLVVYAPGTVQPGQSSDGVETTQVAPTILKLLGLSPGSLQSVQEQSTQVLPGIG